MTACRVGVTRRVSALIVEDGKTFGALPAVRALAASGVRVVVGSPKRSGLAYWSRFTSDWSPVPAVADGCEQFIEATASAVRRHVIDVVFCAGDAEALALAYGSERIPAVMPFPAYALTRLAFDKLGLTLAGTRGGLRSPRTVPADEAGLATFADGPVVVKARLHWTPERSASHVRTEVQMCRNGGEARTAIAGVIAADGVPVLQELIPGGKPFNVHAVIDRRGNLLAAVGTLGPPRFWPPDAGRRTRAEVVPLAPELAEGVRATLVAMGWFGFASLSFLVDDKGCPYFVDFNGRIPLTLDCTVKAAGINVMDLWARVCLDLELSAVSQPRTGTRYHWLSGDIRRALTERRRGLVYDVLETLRYAVGAHHTLLCRADLRPVVRYLLKYAVSVGASALLRKAVAPGPAINALSQLNPVPEPAVAPVVLCETETRAEQG